LAVPILAEAFNLPTGGDHRFHYIHAEDVVRAVLMATETREMKGRIFNIAGDRSWTLHESVNLIRKIMPEAPIEIGDGYWHLDRHGEWDMSAAERELGVSSAMVAGKGTAALLRWAVRSRVLIPGLLADFGESVIFSSPLVIKHD
jgi:UDP-glucose 4-epimerase